jgi:uncharacterized membrane protein
MLKNTQRFWAQKVASKSRFGKLLPRLSRIPGRNAVYGTFRRVLGVMREGRSASRRRGGFSSFGRLLRRLAGPVPGCALLLYLALTDPSLAQFSVCNQTLDVLNLAVAQEVGGTFQTEGWWTIGANRCVDVIKEALTNRYIYVYATDVFNQPILQGDVDMCVDPKHFVISGTEACWQRGHEVAKFAEIDTQAMERWTLFLKEPSNK